MVHLIDRLEQGVDRLAFAHYTARASDDQAIAACRVVCSSQSQYLGR